MCSNAAEAYLNVILRKIQASNQPSSQGTYSGFNTRNNSRIKFYPYKAVTPSGSVLCQR